MRAGTHDDPAPVPMTAARAAHSVRLMSDTVTTIELAPQRRPWWRRGARWAHLACAALVVVGVVAQVYLIGAYVFGAGQDVLEAHRQVGFTTHAVECLVLVAALVAWLPRTDLLLSLALAVLGTAQIALASAHAWTGGLHPLLALVVLGLAAQLARRAMPVQHWTFVRRRKRRQHP
jgi:hypothetical protein